MNHPRFTPSEERLLGHKVDRRRFLGLACAAGAATAVGCAAPGGPDAELSDSGLAPALHDETLPVPSSVEASEQSRSRPNSNRRLVVVEMSGGNDGLATLQPYDDGLLRDRRPNLITEASELIDAGAGFGWHPSLAGIAELGLAGAVGIGSNEPDFSHFEMEQRWWQGVSTDDSHVATGFFGRLCDQLDVGAPVTGLSLSGGPTPALSADRAITVGLSDPGSSWFFKESEPWFDMLRSTYGEMAKASATDTARFRAARSGLADTLRFAESLAEISAEENEAFPWSDLGQQLRYATEVLSVDAGVQIIHVRQDGYDTHTGQKWRHADLLQDLNDSLVALVGELDNRGLYDDTLIVTTSEFGRRVEENDQGTDHGGASTMLVCGAGAKGIHGEPARLNRLDDGNLVAEARFEDYYATIAEDWFGIAATDVLPNGGTAITGLI